MEETPIVEAVHLEALETPATEPADHFGALGQDHWLKKYIHSLMAAYEADASIDFKTAETLLHKEREALEAEVAIALRIFRTYPHLFQHEKAGTAAAA
jgi:hypothetical protein